MKNKPYRWFTFLSALFVTTLIISNIVAVKLVEIYGLILPAAVILFPLAYILGDILTEVYGYARARQVIWIGFVCNLIAVIAISIAGLLPAVSFWSLPGFEGALEAQQAFQAILGFAPRLLAASFVAYLFGEFLNSYVLAKLKIRTEGRFLWLRTITSTLIGEGVDSAIFISLAFWGIIEPAGILITIRSQWLFKVAFETLATPLTYLVVARLKEVEEVDHYDKDTNFNPLSFS